MLELPAENWIFTEAVLSVGSYLKQGFQGVADTLREAGAGSWAMSGPLLRLWSVCLLPDAQARLLPDSWACGAASPAPTKVLLSVDGCRIVVSGGNMTRDGLFSDDADVTPTKVKIFFPRYFLDFFLHLICI